MNTKTTDAQQVTWISEEDNKAEWDRAWAELYLRFSRHDGQTMREVLSAGDGWQYIGTAPLGGRTVHQFRNRCLGGQRTYAHVLAIVVGN